LEQQVHAIRMDITMFVIAAAVLAAPTVTAVMKKSHVIMGSCNDDTTCENGD
jgi:hypothetical protein